LLKELRIQISLFPDHGIKCLHGSNGEDRKESKRGNVRCPGIRITSAGITAEATDHKKYDDSKNNEPGCCHCKDRCRTETNRLQTIGEKIICMIFRNQNYFKFSNGTEGDIVRS
jgi:CO dehydrogenase/acetyl-CoA synthase alpha subunit